MRDKFTQLFRKKELDFSIRSAIFTIAMLSFQVLIGFLVYVSGGTKSVLPQLMSISVAIAALTYGVKAGIFFGFTGGIILGPFILLDIAQGIPQEDLNWLIRMALLISAGGLIGLFKSSMVDFYEDREFLLKIDQFSSLPNRDEFIQSINEKVKAIEPFSIAVIEIRNQRKIISIFGFQFFREILTHVKSEIQRILPDCRLYSIQIDMIGVCSCGNMSGYSRKMVDYFNNPLTIQGVSILCEIAIGIANYPQNGTTASGLIEASFIALDQARVSNKFVSLAPKPDKKEFRLWNWSVKSNKH